jgi:hypothetical protein
LRGLEGEKSRLIKKLLTMQTDNIIIKESLQKLNSLRLEDRAYHSFVRIVNGILSEINVLINTSDDNLVKERLFRIYKSVSHTLHKEVEYIKLKEDEMRKKNSAKIRKKEHYELVSKACEMINLDVFAL